MSPARVFIIRTVLSLAAAWLVSTIYFGRFNPIRMILLAGIMLGLAYVFEAVRRRKG